MNIQTVVILSGHDEDSHFTERFTTIQNGRCHLAQPSKELPLLHGEFRPGLGQICCGDAQGCRTGSRLCDGNSMVICGEVELHWLCWLPPAFAKGIQRWFVCQCVPYSYSTWEDQRSITSLIVLGCVEHSLGIHFHLLRFGT